MCEPESDGRTVGRSAIESNGWNAESTLERARAFTDPAGLEYGFVDTERLDWLALSPSTVDHTAYSPASGSPVSGRRWLVGRETEIQALKRAVLAHRLVTILGPAGIGKTTAAIAVARDLQAQFDGVTYVVDLGSLGDAELIPSAMACAVADPQDSVEAAEAIAAHTSSGRTLLILDGCEHMLDRAATFGKHLYDAAPHVQVLCTSQEPLRLGHEHVYLLGSLATPDEARGISAQDALAYGAVGLFMNRAWASGLPAGLPDADVPLVVDICRRLSGVALALELAGSQVGAHGLSGAAALLDNRFRLLWSGRRSAVSGLQTLQAMIDWSYNLLTTTEQFVLARLAVFIGPFTLDAAQAVVSGKLADEADVARALLSLSDKSLVGVASIDGRPFYRLPQMLRTYAQAKLVEMDDSPDVVARYARSSPGGLKANRVQAPPRSDVEVDGSASS